MKVRINYVSNSSSSSYIISYNNNELTNIEGFKLNPEKFFNYIEGLYGNWDNECTQIKAKGKENISEYIKQHWYDQNQNYIELIKECKEDNIVFLQISYRDELLKDLFDLMVSKKIIKVIYDQNE